MAFESWLKRRDPIFSSVGSKTRPLYKPVLNKNGDIELEEDGFENIYDEIQSYKDSVDINVIVQRYAHGDTYALQQRSGAYGDFVSVPRSYMDVLNGAIELNKIYSENEDFRKSFSTFEDFVVNFGKVDIKSVIPKVDNGSVVEESISNE